MSLGLSPWQAHECASALPGASLLVSLAWGSPAWARCGGRQSLPSVPRALLPTGAGRAAAVPGTSYLGNVRNAPRRGFFLPREPSVPGAETPHPACPASCRQRCPPAHGWLPTCAGHEHPWGSRGIAPTKRGHGVPLLEGGLGSWHKSWAAGCQAWGRRVLRQTGWCWQDLAAPGTGCWAGWQKMPGLRRPLLPTQVCTHPAGDLALWCGASRSGLWGTARSLGWSAGMWSCQRPPLLALLSVPVQEPRVPWSTTQRGAGACEGSG